MVIKMYCAMYNLGLPCARTQRHLANTGKSRESWRMQGMLVTVGEYRYSPGELFLCVEMGKITGTYACVVYLIFAC